MMCEYVHILQNPCTCSSGHAFILNFRTFITIYVVILIPVSKLLQCMAFLIHSNLKIPYKFIKIYLPWWLHIIIYTYIYMIKNDEYLKRTDSWYHVNSPTKTSTNYIFFQIYSYFSMMFSIILHRRLKYLLLK